MFLCTLGVILLPIFIFAFIYEGETDLAGFFAIPLLVWIAIGIYFYINDRREFLSSVFSTIIFLLILLLLGLIF